MAGGKALESLILRSQGAACGAIYQKVPNGIQWVGGGKSFPCKSPVDFMGLLTDGTARSLVFDAKECKLVTRFPVGHKDHVSPHQLEQLIRYGRSGALAGLLVAATSTRRLYWLSWRYLVNAPPSYPWDDPRMVDIGSAAMAIDWRKVATADALPPRVSKVRPAGLAVGRVR